MTSAIQYLRQELAGSSADFVAQWKSLSEKDKDDLREYARREMEFVKGDVQCGSG